MSTIPTGPVFFADADPKSHWIELNKTIETTKKKLAGAKPFECVGYDADLTAWTYSTDRAPQVSLWARITTRYNMVEVPVQWTNPRPYELEELRRIFLDAVEHDDDVYTQFVGREELTARLQRCESFSDFVEVWEWLSEEQFDED